MHERLTQLIVKKFTNWDVVQSCFPSRNKAFVSILSTAMEEMKERIKEERKETDYHTG